MKKIFILLTAFTLAIFAGCKKDQLITVSSSITAPTIKTPADATVIVVTPADSAQLVSIKWSKSNYGVQAVVNYFVEVDLAGNNFSKHIFLGNTTKDSLSMTLGAINSRLLNSLSLPANAASTIELRTGSAIYGRDSVFSKPIKITFTTFKALAPDKLYVPGAYQDWSPGTALSIPSTSLYNYEGFIYMKVGDYFKFTSAPDWDHINYGDAGGGNLTEDGLAGGLKVNDAGYYKLNADIKNLKYSATWIQTFGIIGTATPHGWDASTAMTFNTTTGLWSVKLDLVSGALKFRANNGWDINYGPADSNALTGTLIQTDGAISIPVDGNYTVTIDMSQSSQKKYLYTVVKN